MDFFTEKLAEHWGSKEMIKANSQAEAEEMRRMETEMEEYKAILEQMRVVGEQNAQMTAHMTQLADRMDMVLNTERESGPSASTEELKQEIQREMQELSDTMQASLRKSEDFMESSMRTLQASLEEKLAAQDENSHRENVKVFRNVQAVVVDEIKAQTGELELSNRVLMKKLRGCKSLMVVSVVLASVSLAFSVCDSLGLIEKLIDFITELF